MRVCGGHKGHDDGSIDIYTYVYGGGFVLVSSNDVDVDKLYGGIIYINTQPKNIKTTPSTHKRA